MGDDFGDLRAGDAILFSLLEMIGKRTVGDALRDKRGDRHEAAVAQRQKIIAAPYLAEKDIVV